MKKLLICLLCMILIGLSINLYRNETKKENAIPEQTEIPKVEEVDLNKSYAPIEIDNVTGFETSWYAVSTDGNVSSTSSYNQQILTIESSGSDLSCVSLYREGISLIKDNAYIISFDVESSISRKIEVILRDTETKEVFFSKIIEIDKPHPERLDFVMDKENSINSEIVISIGNDGQEATQSSHTITIGNLMILNNTISDNSIKVNHVGYNVNDQKLATFPYNQGDFFNVVDVNTEEVVYTGAIVNKVSNVKTGETNFTGDFTNVVTPGKYRIESQLIGTSYEFEIGSNVFKTLSNDLLKMLTAQRCGMDLLPEWVGDLAHGTCHHGTATIVKYTEEIDVTGGWHDAGDYGRYVETGVKTLSDILFAYMNNPSYFGDDLGMPESGNGVSDVLDEAKYELEWLFKMQTAWGEVYNRAVTNQFAGDISPDEDYNKLFVIGPSSTATGDFVAIMALSSVIYKDIDPAFSERCLVAAKLSWDSLMSSINTGEVKNPEDIIAGEYRDTKDTDERFYAAIAMFSATNDNEYLKVAKEQFNQDNTSATGISWREVGGYGRYLYLMNDKVDKNDEFYKQLYHSLIKDADAIFGNAASDGYNTGLDHYSWGSNGSIADNGVILTMAYNISGDMRYRQTAVEQLNYLLGKNVLNISYVSGEGYNYPVNMHHRVSKAKNTVLKGALVGGANSDRDDAMLQLFKENTPPAKMYIDKYDSYSTNEVAIYWNSALINLITSLGILSQ